VTGVFSPSPNVLSQSQAYWNGILTSLQQGGPLSVGSAAANAILAQVQLGLTSAQQEVLAVDYELANAAAAGTSASTALQMTTALTAAADLTVQEAVLRVAIGYFQRVQTNMSGS
jgi:hypothetical protein